MIESAGGIVWRLVGRQQHEVLIVHRPARQDWSFPKGRRRQRESALDCAVREVGEETGMQCTIDEELPEVRYIDRQGRSRLVRYWLMQVERGEFQPNNEVDEIRWTPIAQAGELLTLQAELVLVSGLRLVGVDA